MGACVYLFSVRTPNWVRPGRALCMLSVGSCDHEFCCVSKASFLSVFHPPLALTSFCLHYSSLRSPERRMMMDVGTFLLEQKEEETFLNSSRDQHYSNTKTRLGPNRKLEATCLQQPNCWQSWENLYREEDILFNKWYSENWVSIPTVTKWACSIVPRGKQTQVTSMISM